MKTVFLFPGQGAQAVGMGKDVVRAIPQAAAVYEKASRILGLDLAQLCFEGPAEQLNTTAMSQPAIFVTSVALLEALKASRGCAAITPDVCAGLSLGEYTALHVAGVIGFEDALRLVRTRGQAMQAAADASPGAMVSIIGLDPPKAQALCDQAAQGELLRPANYNCPGQIVISGTKAACGRAEAMAAGFGAAKAVRLEVAGAFHTPLMAPAAATLEQALAGCPLRDPSPTRVLSNVTAEYYPNPRSVPSGLVRQLTSPVLWQGCMERLLGDGVERFFEIGPGKVLTALMRRIHRRADIVNISDLASLQGADF